MMDGHRALGQPRGEQQFDSASASLRVGHFVDGALDPVSVGSAPSQAGSVEQRTRKRMAL
jgi:hypothetical protein